MKWRELQCPQLSGPALACCCSYKHGFLVKCDATFRHAGYGISPSSNHSHFSYHLRHYPKLDTTETYPCLFGSQVRRATPSEHVFEVVRVLALHSQRLTLSTSQRHLINSLGSPITRPFQPPRGRKHGNGAKLLRNKSFDQSFEVSHVLVAVMLVGRKPPCRRKRLCAIGEQRGSS